MTETTAVPATTEDIAALEAAVAELRAALGEDAVLVGEAADEFVDPYEPVSWGGQRNHAAVQPADTEQVQAVVRIANKYKIPLWVGSQGRNNGYGGSGSVVSGSIIVNLRRMNRVLKVDDELGYVVVEPGVSYFDLYEHVRETGAKVMIDVPDLGWGSVIGNACDHGFGYTKYGDHYGAVCGMEVVLPDGEILRTGMGGLEDTRSWHVYRTGYGPNPEGLFLQSNYGIVTRMGLWVMPRPDAYMNCMIRIERDEQLPALIDAIRPLMVDGTIPNIPSCFNTAGIMTMLGKRKEFWAGEGPMPEEVLEGVRQKTGLGAWMMRFALYGRDAQVDEAFGHVQAVLADLPGISVTGQKHDPAALDDAGLDQSGQVQAGIPNMDMLPAVKFVGDNGGHVGFSSVVPLTGEDSARIVDLVREQAAANGVDYTATFMITPRSAIHVFLAFFDRDDEAGTRRAYAMCRGSVPEAAAIGYGEYRAHVSMMDTVAAQFSFGGHAQRRFNERIKDALDPNGILMSGRSGIWPERLRGVEIETPWTK
ncbi:FAD-dependent oxidoreductase [Streptomyces sp. NPDC003247]|uniref:FAD-dependent oxidoreductase n=1 Tax=Streptomyces sp. NPDC003247 TaxID=3364677 RepID=UPI0036A8BD98